MKYLDQYIGLTKKKITLFKTHKLPVPVLHIRLLNKYTSYREIGIKIFKQILNAISSSVADTKSF